MRLLSIATAALISFPVAAVAQPSGATEGDIRDIRGAIPGPPEPTWPLYLLLAAAAAILLYAGYRTWRHFQARARRPHRVARRRIESAVRAFDPRSHRLDRLADEISGAVRDYIEAVFAMPAAHRSTEEFLGLLVARPESCPDLVPYRHLLTDLLATCDLAKFAGREVPTELTTDISQAALRFVDTTHRDRGNRDRRQPRSRLRRFSKRAAS